MHALPIGNLIESLEVCFFFQTVYLVFFKIYIHTYNISSITTLAKVKIKVIIVPVRPLMARKPMKV
jgi:hypothetical protein